MTIETRTDLLMSSLTNFYTKNYIQEIDDIINFKSELSLRVLDWFVTNYSKKYIIILNSVNKGGGFNVYQNYKLQLKSYSKSNFDPFCRKDKLLFYYSDNNKYIETSCGQLCFFRWCFENNILDYIKKNLIVIERDMRISLNKHTDTSAKRKRQSLSVSASRGIVKHNSPYKISFD